MSIWMLTSSVLLLLLSNRCSFAGKLPDRKSGCSDDDAVPYSVSKYNGKWYVQGYTSPTGNARFRFEIIIINAHHENKTGTYTISYVTFDNFEVHTQEYSLHMGPKPGTFIYWDPRVPCLTTHVRVIVDDKDGMVLQTRNPNSQKAAVLIVTSKVREYSEDKLRALFNVAVIKCGSDYNFTRVHQNNCM